jgi:hypothetical protein
MSVNRIVVFSIITGNWGELLLWHVLSRLPSPDFLSFSYRLSVSLCKTHLLFKGCFLLTRAAVSWNADIILVVLMVSIVNHLKCPVFSLQTKERGVVLGIATWWWWWWWWLLLLLLLLLLCTFRIRSLQPCIFYLNCVGDYLLSLKIYCRKTNSTAGITI